MVFAVGSWPLRMMCLILRKGFVNVTVDTSVMIAYGLTLYQHWRYVHYVISPMRDYVGPALLSFRWPRRLLC